MHRYSIADGIRDKNVLGFDLYRVATFKDKDIREQVALIKSKANTYSEVLADPKKKEIYHKYMDSSQVKMAGIHNGQAYEKGIEDYIPMEQYRNIKHQKMVVKDILDNWFRLSQGGKFHAIFATSSINEAIEYYRLIKNEKPDLKITTLFDPTIDNNENFVFKEEGLVEILEDYNNRYGQLFSLATHAKFKKDLSNRLAHKEQYKYIEKDPEQQLDILIVVDQMLTGFDSKWLNTLYMDKLMEYENIIQAFSRTNRLFGHDKPFGTIRYYRKPHTMEQNIDKALKLYSGDKPFGLFVDNLERNLEQMNHYFGEIDNVFKLSGISDFESLPSEMEVCGQFAKLFNQLNKHLNAAKIQGFKWDTLSYSFKHENNADTSITLMFDEQIYLILALRYKELCSSDSVSGDGEEGISFDIEGYLTEIDTGKIDSNYMNASFNKYLKELKDGSSDESLSNALSELHKTFASLTQTDQKFANIFLRDVERGEVELVEDKTLQDYINEYKLKDQENKICEIVKGLGVDETLLKRLLSLHVTKDNLNEYDRFGQLMNTVDKVKAKQYFEDKEGRAIKAFEVNIKADELLRKFILREEIK